ncbi:MAG: 2-C-methyl-D-erythritol 2,4-cyclodiphosphate synthase [Pseudomonadota bacterium]
MRIGHGYDLHRLEPGSGLKLGGHYIACPYAIVAHSDGDVVLHALCDALLGATALGDIGRLFPDADPQYKGKDSLFFLNHVYNCIKSKGYTVINVDITIQAETPKISPHADPMKTIIANTLNLPVDAVSIKAKTMEKLGPIGERQAIAAHVVTLLIGENS